MTAEELLNATWYPDSVQFNINNNWNKNVTNTYNDS